MIARVIRSVLIVDDDPEFRQLAGRLLAASGMTVVGEADSVAGALEAAARLEPAAALVDVELPDGDGVTLARQLAALPWHPGSFSPRLMGRSRPPMKPGGPALARS